MYLVLFDFFLILSRNMLIFSLLSVKITLFIDNGKLNKLIFLIKLLHVKMKRFKFFILSALLSAGALFATSCGGDDDEEEPSQNNGTETPSDKPNGQGDPDKKTFTVTFDTNGGSKVDAQTVEDGAKATKPADPTKDGFSFVKWTNDGVAYNFDDAVKADLTLKAVWEKVIVYPEGAIIGAFSVSATKKVAFSSGNLQYQASTQSWRFAPNQTDVIGADNANISTSYDGWIDLFGWGTGLNPTSNGIEATGYASFNDWGKQIGDGKTWYTLSNKEWKYLLKTRKNASQKYGMATVNSVNGVVLLPDDFTLPDGVTFMSGAAADWGDEFFKSINEYSADQWALMQQAGAVFLPAAGYRGETELYRMGWEGDYWASSSYDEFLAYCMGFFSDDISADGYNTRSYGYAVRLVNTL